MKTKGERSHSVDFNLRKYFFTPRTVCSAVARRIHTIFPNMNDGVDGPAFLCCCCFFGGNRIDVSHRNYFHNTIKEGSLVL